MFIKINKKIINLDKVIYIDFYKDKAITFWFNNGSFLDVGVYISMGIKITEDQYSRLMSFLHLKLIEVF